MIKLTNKLTSRPFFRFFMPAAIILLPLLVLGGSVSNASAPMPQTTVSSGQTVVVRVYFHDNAERDRLAVQLGAEEAPTTGGYLTVIADQTLYAQILKMGLKTEIDRQETDALNSIKSIPPDSPNTFYGGFKTVEEMQAFMAQYATTYPTLAQVVDYGQSYCLAHGGCTFPTLTWAGYNLEALHITNQAIPGPKPVFWYEAGIHSREIATPEIAADYIQWLLDNYNSDAEAHWLVDYTDIYVVPMTNPDGHHIVEAGGGGSSPYYQRKNADNSVNCGTWPPNEGSQPGVDNNRNFPFLWNCCGGSSSSPCDQTYHGVSGGSDPEASAVVSEIRTLVPDQRGPNIGDSAPITSTGLFQDMHSNASLDLYPWGMYTTPAPNGPELANIGKHMSASNAYPSGNSYQACQPPLCLYAVDGDAFDWAYGDLGMAGYSTEVGGSDFFVPLSYVQNTLWPANKGALIYQAKASRQPYLLAHGPDSASVATVPMTVTQGTPAQLNGTINYAWSGDTLSQNVGAAEYYVDTPPWAGGTPIAMTGSFGSPTVPVQATVDTSSLSIGRHILFVRGRGVNDFSGLQTWGPVTATWLWVVPGGGPTPTLTPGVPPTWTATQPPSETPTTLPVATETATAPGPTNTGGVPTFTATTVGTVVATDTPGGVASVTPTTCVAGFSDVPPGSTFYSYIHCLTCLGIVNGYPDGTFRPNNPVTRGQIAKIVSNSAGYNEPEPIQQFQDVPPTGPGSTFFVYINRLAIRGYINGYPCGRPGEQCVPPANLPYFRPNATATRGQIAKIVCEASGCGGTPTGQQFQDVPVGSAFYTYTYNLVSRGVMSGYPCGTPPAGPCVPPDNLPYFRPNANASRGQTSKIVANTFFPDCNLSDRSQK